MKSFIFKNKNLSKLKTLNFKECIWLYNNGIVLSFLIGILILLSIFFVSFFSDDFQFYYQEGGYQAVIENYKTEVDKYAKEFNLPSSYLLALIMLESSGKKYVKPRFEKKIYKKLLKLKKGEISNFEQLTTNDIKNYSRKELKDLAKSWGPFQIMGYKALELNNSVDIFKSSNVVYWSIKWIDKDYGDLIREGRFRDAFHWHNTGRLFPQDGYPLTYDKSYVERGLRYMRYFSKLY